MSDSRAPKIFCTGLSRTGTTALCAALETFRLRTVHWPIHLFAQSEALGLPPFRPALKLGPYAAWRRGKELKASRVLNDARRILENNDAFGDLPVPLFYRQLDEMFPGSFFIHTTRSLEGWLKSMKWLFNEGGILWRRGRLADELHWRIYGTTRFDRERLRAAFLRHENEARAFIQAKGPKGLLLEIDAAEMTYERLASFLGMSTDKSGPVSPVNQARDTDASVKGIYRFARILQPFHLAFRRLGGKPGKS
jgi:hypothetical protein